MTRIEFFLYLLAAAIAVMSAGCVTQRTLCEELEPEQCEQVVHVTYDKWPPMRPVFDPPIERR